MSIATDTPATTVQAVEAAHVLQTYKRQPVVFVRGEGVWLVADDGTRYLDMLSGIGVNVLGHAHPALVAAVREQVGELVHTSNLFFHPFQGQLAARLTKASGLERAFFCNSGAEAVEGCLKFARRFWYTAGTPRTAVHRVRTRLLGPHDGRAVDDMGRALPDALRTARARGALRLQRGSGRPAVCRERPDGRDHRRADPGRRRRATAAAADRGRHQQGVRRQRRAVHRR